MKRTVMIFVILVLFSLAACKHSQSLQTIQGITPDDVEVQTSTFTEVTDTPNPGIMSPSTCIWNWASEPLPELSDTFTAALEAQGLTGVIARASAYGENCIDPNTSQIIGFATMETDWYVTINLASLEDNEQIGNQLKIVIEVIQSLQDIAPGPNPGYVGIRLISGEQEENLWFLFSDGMVALNQGLTGQALLDALQ